jgi:hypothetical protein
MKKVTLTIGGVSREVPANEYPMRFLPKKDAGLALVNGKDSITRFTEGRGKSAINNHYIYFVEGDKLYFLRSTAAEVAAARKEKIIVVDINEAIAAGEQPQPAAEPEPEKVEETKPVEKPKARRQRVKA